MAETIERVIVNKITKAKFDELVEAGTITPAMIREQTWIFTDDQYVSASNISDWNSKQPALVSGNNIKTINSQSILGSGDLSIEGQAFKGYIKDNNYINLNNYDPGVYYVLDGTTYSLVNNPGPNQRRMFNHYLIFLSTGYTLVIEKKVADVNVGDVFAYAYGFAQNSDGLKAETVQFLKSAATSTYGFSFNDIVSSTVLLPPVVSTNQTQTISAKKTFTVLPESSVTPQADEQLVNKKYVDDSIPTVPTNVSAFTNDAGYITGINSGDVTTALGYTPVNPNVIGVADGIAELDSTGKVPSAQLPSYVDDVIEGYYNTVDGKFYEESTYTTEIPGESGKIYVDLTTNKTYRWGGSAFAEISESLALGTTSTTAFRGDHGEVAYQHALSPHAKIVNVESGRYESASTPFELGGLKAGLYLFECNGGVNPTVYFTYGGSTAESMEVSPGFNTLYIPADIPLYADNTYGVEDVLGVFYGIVLDETNKTMGCVDSQLLFDDHMSAHMYIDSLVNSSLTLPTNTSDLNNDSGFITGMTILSYGHSTWNDFITAYTADKVVYCRASSNSNPGTGSQNRLAFMAYLNNATSPTEVEFQYYRSVSSHSDSQQGDQMYVYKLTSSGTWTVTVRNSFSKVVAGTNLTSTYANSAITLNAPSNVSAFTNDSGYLTSETDPIFSASAAAGITSSDIANWNNKAFLGPVSDYNTTQTAFNLNGLKAGVYYFYADSRTLYLKVTNSSTSTDVVSNAAIDGADEESYIINKMVYLYITNDIPDTGVATNTNLGYIRYIRFGLYNEKSYENSVTVVTYAPDIIVNANSISLSSAARSVREYLSAYSYKQTLSLDYSTSSTYNVGDYVNRWGTLYQCNTAITTPEAWTSAHWTSVGLFTIDLLNKIQAKQDTLVSGTNIKTINGNSLLGSGDIVIQGGGSASIYDLSDLLAVTTPADQVYVDILADIQDNAEIRILNTISATQEELYTVIKSEYDPTPSVPSYIYYYDEQNKYTKLTLTDDGTDASITKSIDNDFLFYNKALNSETVSGWGSDLRCWINSNQWSSNKFVIEGKPTGIYLFDAIAPYSGSYVPQKIAGATNATGYLDVLGIQFMIIIKDYTSASAGETVALWWGAGKAGPQYGTLRKQAVNSSYPAGLQGGNDNNSSSEIYVNLLLAQTIAGKKTFTTLPEANITPTTNNQLTRKKYVDDSVATKQDTLVSGTNIKTVNGNSLLGSGDIVISGGSQKYVGTITGDGTTTSFTITHNLDSRDVIVQVYDNTSYETVIVDVTRDTVNTVQIDFTTAPVVDKVYKVVVM